MAQTFLASRSIMKVLLIKPAKADIENVDRFNVKVTIIPVCLFMFIMGEVMFIIRVAENVAQYSDCSYAMTAQLTEVSAVILINWNIQDLYDLIEDVEKKIAKRRENPTSKIIYEKADQTIAKYTSALYILFIQITVYGVMAINFVSAMVAYGTTGLEDHNPRFPFLLWFPFKQKLITYLIQFIFQTFAIYYSLHMAVLVFTFLVEFCFTIMAYAEDLKTNIQYLNGLDVSKEHGNEEIQDKIFEVISFHSHTKQCVGQFLDVYGKVLTMYVVCCLLGICQSLLVFDSEISKESPDYVLLIQSIIKMMHGAGTIFLFCEFGEQLSGRFDEVNDEIGQLKWYTFTVDMQRVMLVLIANTQQPIQITGFGNIVCGRDTFKRIVNTSWTYFMIFREFE